MHVTLKLVNVSHSFLSIALVDAIHGLFLQELK